MRVAILNLTGGGLSGGSRKYLLNMIPRLVADPAIEALLCATPSGLNLADWFGDLPKVKFVSCRPVGFFNGIFSYKDNNLKRELEEFKTQVLYVPLDRYVKFSDVPTVVMIRNMEPYKGSFDDDPLSEKMKKTIQAKLARRASERADRVIAVSEFVRDFLIQVWRIDPEKIALIYHGAELQESNQLGEKPLCIPDTWEEKFIFSAGSVRPARGLEDLIHAIVMGHGLGRECLGVVVAGETTRSMTEYREKLTDILRQAGAEKQLIWADSLDDAQMRWCYRNCRAFVMTSRVEACPNIAIESLAHSGVNVVADNPPLPEFFQSSAVYYRPGDTGSLLATLDKALSVSEDERARYLREGQTRAKDFSWDTTASLTIETLMHAITDSKVSTGKS
jgi:glycosyltransferase involved in cell wall biosynthesis